MVWELILSTTPPLEALELFKSLTPKPDFVSLQIEEETFMLGEPKMVKKKSSHVDLYADDKDFISSK